MTEDNRRLPPSTEVERSRGATPRKPADASSSTARLAPGELLGGRYRVERKLGEGGMGVVYLVADEQIPGERFAIKVLKEELHVEALAVLREEVRKTRKLSHPNIVDVHSVNVDGKRLYVLMEYLEGKSLRALLVEEFGRGLPFSHAWPIIKDVGAALANAHDHNVIHSDLKPENVLVTTSGRTKLLDFGIARAARGPRLQGAIGPRALTPEYASCEMLEGKEADRRDDIYSFACVIYEMLCGERPFGGLTAIEAREAGVQMAPLEALSRARNAALARALSFAREARTASVEKLLEGFALEHPPKRHSAALAGALVVVLLAAAGLTYWAVDRLRGASRPGEGAVSNAEQPAPVAPGPTPASSGAPDSIAVLPFVNISGDKEQEYFSDGLSEELIDHLAHSADLKVIARSSSFQFKGKNEDARSIARKLGVTHVLEGSVRKEGQQLRITAELIRSSDGMHLWSQTYDRSLIDIFKVQEDIGERVSQALHVALREGYSAASAEPDVRAYNLVLEGNYFKARRTLPDVERAAQLYQQALDINPGYALAWARLASAYLAEEIMQGPPAATQSKKVLDALDHATRLDPNLAWAYYTRAGFEMSIMWNWAAAKTDIERLQEIDQRFDLLPSARADIAIAFGDVDKALEFERDDLARNPLDPNALDSFGIALCAAGRLEECLQTRLKLLQLHPEFDGVNGSVGLARLYLGQYREALQSMLNEPNGQYRLGGLALIYWATGRRSESNAALHSLAEGFASIDAYGIAVVHAYRGEIDDAFRWLDRAYQQHDNDILQLKTDPRLRNLRADPRFHAMLSRMNLLN